MLGIRYGQIQIMSPLLIVRQFRYRSRKRRIYQSMSAQYAQNLPFYFGNLLIIKIKTQGSFIRICGYSHPKASDSSRTVRINQNKLSPSVNGINAQKLASVTIGIPRDTIFFDRRPVVTTELPGFIIRFRILCQCFTIHHFFQ